jgi:hypothetical protein
MKLVLKIENCKYNNAMKLCGYILQHLDIKNISALYHCTVFEEFEGK